MEVFLVQKAFVPVDFVRLRQWKHVILRLLLQVVPRTSPCTASSLLSLFLLPPCAASPVASHYLLTTFLCVATLHGPLLCHSPTVSSPLKHAPRQHPLARAHGFSNTMGRVQNIRIRDRSPRNCRGRTRKLCRANRLASSSFREPGVAAVSSCGPDLVPTSRPSFSPFESPRMGSRHCKEM